MAIRAFFGLLLVSAALAQEPTRPAPQEPPAPPPPLEYTGKPLALPFRCTDEDILLAGLTCSEEDPCPIYLEMTSVESAGNRLLVSGNLHSSAVTMFSIMLVSDDAGRTWREAHERLRGAALDRIQVLDPDNAWVSGHVVSALPQDPFFLRTADGGKTWRQRPVFSESAENRLGVIQQFLFDDKDNGSLIIDRGQGSEDDRYELYESRDGGESWSIRESSSKPLRLKRMPPPASAEWRLRADAPSRAFHIEHKQGEHWAMVASFLVRAGVCKPQ